MKNIDLWKKYCSFYEKDFSEHIEYNKERMEKYFERWKKTDLAKVICKKRPVNLKEVPLTTYEDYWILGEFGQKIENETKRNPRKPGELFKDYYDRISHKLGFSLSRYMVEPFYLCMKTTGTTGTSKWIAHGETFWKNFVESSIAMAVISGSDSWGETKVKIGEKALNLNAAIPCVSGWGAWATKNVFEMVPPIEVADNMDMKEKFNFMLSLLKKGEKITLGGGIGALFYMICKYFLDPEEFYREYYHSLGFGLKKILLYLKIMECKLTRRERKRITDTLPLKGILIAGTEAKLYLEFFKREFNIEPLHIYGSTEAGPIMRGDPDRKMDLIPDLRTCYLEFQMEDGVIKEIDELKKGEVYNIVVTPYGSILFRYVMDDLLRVIDFRDDGMPIFSFEGRKKSVMRLYGRYTITPRVIVNALYNAGLRSSDKWAVTKTIKPKERLHFLMEKTWIYSEREAEKRIFKALVAADKALPRHSTTLKNLLSDFRIRDPSELVKVTYLKPGAFLRYSMIKAKEGAPIGQYKPPKIIPPERHDIYETLINA